MRIWKHDFTAEGLTEMGKNTIGEQLDIRFEEAGDDYLKASMPVDDRTVQPARILHGGASVVLAETLGSVASTLCLTDLSKEMPVGLEVSASHLRSVTSGRVTGTVKPIRVGRTVHVWEIHIHDERGRLCCHSKLTVSIIKR
jgi:1,4-dihydroxy-2-naphthoyl-CoA hydrolase